MNFTEAVTNVFKNYATFSGRAARSEYWYWYLFYVLSNLILGVLDHAVLSHDVSSSGGPLETIFWIATIVPYLAVGARRLHDVERSGWWQLLILIPIIGWLVLLVWGVTKGTEGPNEYGPDSL